LAGILADGYHQTMQIDLNADLAEGMDSDLQLMPLISSANISCLAHAGDPKSVRLALIAAKQFRVAVGAHVGYFDRESFGRKEWKIDEDFLKETFASCLYQIGALIAFAKHFKKKVKYVKPHGALYNQANANPKLGEAIFAACFHYRIPMVGLAGSPLHKKYEDDTAFICEGFADRAYNSDGTLVPRDQPGAVLHDVPTILKQIEWLVNEKNVQTICIHGDTPDAVHLATATREALIDTGYQVQSFV
jgi:5-oxoprolinase (ATP-hydrolysing) subunit A